MNMKKIFNINTKKNSKEKEGKKKNRKKGKTVLLMILEFRQFQVLHMEYSWEKLIFNCSYLVAVF